MAHSWPQTPHGETVAKPGTLLLIHLNLICKSSIKGVHGKLSNPLVENEVSGKNCWGVGGCWVVGVDDFRKRMHT